MKQPSLEEVKDYFKNAEIVVPIDDENENINITKGIKKKIHYWYNSFWIDIKGYSGGSVLLWCGNTGKYAEILTYKEKTFSITESQLKLIHGLSTDQVQDNITDWFPEAFESEVKSLPKDFTGWCKIHNMGNDDWLMYFEEGIQKYGIDSNKEWFVPAGVAKIKSYYSEATEQEVFEALKDYALKIGVKLGVSISRDFDKELGVKLGVSISRDFDKELGNVVINTKDYQYDDEWYFDMSRNFLEHYGFVVYSNGSWCKVLETITLSEAEQQLGKKIIV